MSYELKEYLNSINITKKNLMDGDDPLYERKYPAYIINKCLAPFNETIMLVNEMNKHCHLDNKQRNLEYVKEYFGYNNEKARAVLNILTDEQIATIKIKLNKGGKK